MAEHHRNRSGRTLFALGLGYPIDQGEGQSMGVLSPIIQSIWGVSFGMIGLMETLRNITQTVSAPLWGYIADRYSRKKVLIFGTGVWGLWTIGVGLVPGFTSMMIIRAISGLGLGCLMPATFSLLGDHYPQSQRGRALGFIGLVRPRRCSGRSHFPGYCVGSSFPSFTLPIPKTRKTSARRWHAGVKNCWQSTTLKETAG